MSAWRAGAALVIADVGNTKVQVAVYSGGRLRRRWRLPTRAVTAAQRDARRRVVRATLWDHDTPALLASVAPGPGAWVERWLRRASRQVHVARWSDPWPFRIAVRNPHTVGVDRLANVAGLVARGLGTGIAVDAGTATTIDVLRRGRFVGGLILAGPALQLAALHRGTSLLPAAAAGANAPLIGRDTVSALQAGAVHGTRHALAGVVAELRSGLGASTPVVVTGGAAALGSLVGGRTARDPDLVLHGLRALAQRLQLVS